MKRLYSNIPPVMTRKDLQDILQISKNTALELLQTKQIDSFMNEPPRSRATGYQKPSFSLACYAASCGELNPKRLKEDTGLRRNP